MGSRQNMCAILFCFFFWLFFFCFIFFRSWEKQKKKIVVDEDSGKRVDPTCCICLIRFCKTKMFFHPRKEGHRCRRNRMDDGPFCFPFNPLHIFFLKAKKKANSYYREQKNDKKKEKKKENPQVSYPIFMCVSFARWCSKTKETGKRLKISLWKQSFSWCL